ncbi:phage tail tape measure protein [Bifidobacterium samirii]|uniref:Phage tail protein n=1 Tax=Bifidobacterium samirii TaxID=2306974 RepID=A0A430FUF1_9BIFI|nr:phage tail tape measure protein [Bifidobacterium samirii]RSX56776.1 phage tail protein [Bifidobacterium samirii]
MAGLNENIMIRLMADTTNYTTKMRAASAQATKLSTALETPMSTGERVGATLTKVGMAAGALSTAIGVAAVATFAEFDAAMSTVQANTGASADEMDSLRQAAIDAGANTVYSASEAADAINELGKAGMSTTDILSGGLTGALDLAASDGMQVSEAAELMSSAMAQFNLTGSDAGKVADALAAGAGKAQGSARDLGYALQQSGMVANSFGIGMQETVGTLTAFANAGMIGSDAGTSLKTMLIALANPSTKASGLMEELGIHASNAQGDFVGLADLAGQLQTQMGGLTQEQRNQALATIFGSDAIRAANVLYKEGADGIDEWTKAVDESGYAAAQAAAKNDNLKGDIENLTGSVESMLITIGSGANGPLRSIVQTVDKAVDAFSSLPAPVQQSAIGLGMLAGALTLAHKQFGPMSESSSKVAKGMSALLDPMQYLQRAAPGVTTGVQSIASAFKGSGAQIELFGTSMSRTTAIGEGFKSIGSGLLSMLGGPWGITIGLAGAALMTFASKAQQAQQRADSLKTALETTGNATDQIIDNLRNAPIDGSVIIPDFIEQAIYGYKTLGELLDDVGIKMSDMALAAQGNSDAMSRVTAVTDDMVAKGGNQAELAGIIISYLKEEKANYEEVSEEAQKKAEALDEVAHATGEAGDATEAYATAAEEAATADDILADSFGATTDGISDQAAALGEVIDAMNTYYGFSLNESDALISMHDAFDKATESIQKNGATLDINSEKGRANQSALNDIAKTAMKAAQAQAENGASMDDINSTLDLSREKYIAAAQAMGMTPEAASEAATAAGLTKEKFDQLATSVESVTGDHSINLNVDTGLAEGQLQSLGVTVETLPDGTIRIGGDNTDAVAAIAEVNGLPVDEKSGTVTLDSSQYDIALAIANGATIDEKTGYLKGDGSEMLTAIAEVNGWTIDEKTGVISGDDGPFKATTKAVENRKIAGKTVKVDADASGFWGTVNNILGRVFKVNVGADGKASGGIIGYAAGGLMGRDGIPRYASGGLSGLLGGIGSKISDSNLIWASRGEYMMKARAVDHYGVGFMDSVNSMRYRPDEGVQYMPAPVLTASADTAVIQSNEAVVAELRAFRAEIGPIIAAYAPTIGKRDFQRLTKEVLRQ